VDTSHDVKKKRSLRLRGSSSAIEEDSSFYSADYYGTSDNFEFVSRSNGEDYIDEDEYMHLYQNPRQGWRQNGVGNKRAHRMNGRSIGVCWECNGVPITQYCKCRDGPRNADRWVHRDRVRNNGRRGHPNGGVGIGSEQVDGTAVA